MASTVPRGCHSDAPVAGRRWSGGRRYGDAMGDDDPDAMWRPGYTGPVVYRRAPSAGRVPARPCRRRWRPCSSCSPCWPSPAGPSSPCVHHRRDGPSALTLAPRVPAELRAAVVGDVDGRVGSLVAGRTTAPSSWASTAGGRASSRSTPPRAAERGATDLPKGRVESIDVLGDVVVAVSVGRDGSGMVVGVRTDEGTTSWTRSVAPGDRATVDAGQVLVSHASTGASGARLDLLDPSTGRGRRVDHGRRGVVVAGRVQRRVGDRIELVDRRVVPRRRRRRPGAARAGRRRRRRGRRHRRQASSWRRRRPSCSSTTAVASVPRCRSTRARRRCESRPPRRARSAGRFVAVQQGDHLVVLSTDGRRAARAVVGLGLDARLARRRAAPAGGDSDRQRIGRGDAAADRRRRHRRPPVGRPGRRPASRPRCACSAATGSSP